MELTRSEWIAAGRAHVANGTGRRIRKEAHLTQAAVAAEVRVSPDTVARWEAQDPYQRRLPRDDAAIRYAQYLARIAAQRYLPPVVE